RAPAHGTAADVPVAQVGDGRRGEIAAGGRVLECSGGRDDRLYRSRDLEICIAADGVIDLGAVGQADAILRGRLELGAELPAVTPVVTPHFRLAVGGLRENADAGRARRGIAAQRDALLDLRTSDDRAEIDRVAQVHLGLLGDDRCAECDLRIDLPGNRTGEIQR